MRREARRAASLLAAAILIAASSGATAAADDDAPAPAQTQAQAQAHNALAFSGQISGNVYTRDKKMLSGTTVAVVGSSGDSLHGSSTDPKGHYAVGDLEKDDYSVIVVPPSGAVLRKDGVRVRPLFRNLVDFVVDPGGPPAAMPPQIPEAVAEKGGTFALAVHLTTTEGRTVPEARVTVARVQGDAGSLTARTDAGGDAGFTGLRTAYYRITVRALGHVTWSLGPVLLQGSGAKSLDVRLMPFPLGHKEKIENLVVPIDPASPAAFDAEKPPEGAPSGQPGDGTTSPSPQGGPPSPR